MDEFVNTLDADKFRSTNGLWNSLMLNDPWSVGYVTTLIETKAFNAKEEWEEFYYESGAKRDNLISSFDADSRNILNDEQLIKVDKLKIEKLSWNLKAFNLNFGRTQKQFEKKGGILFNYIESGNNISLEECIECIRFRVICETWNGVILRERNTISALKKAIPDIEYRKTTGAFDHQYAVDYELFLRQELICGVQIKPNSYLGKSSFLEKARIANQEKNKKYYANCGKKVFDVISKTDGTIINTDVIEKIKMESINSRK